MSSEFETSILRVEESQFDFDTERASSLGAKAVRRKPFRHEELILKLRNDWRIGSVEPKIKGFIKELSDLEKTAGETLFAIEQNMGENQGMFLLFSGRMIAIRGTAEQLHLPDVAKIARLAEEIAIRAVHAKSRPQIRKCIGSLWDALTTIKYLVEHDDGAGHVQQILVNRLGSTLRSLGGARPVLNQNEVSDLLKTDE